MGFGWSKNIDMFRLGSSPFLCAYGLLLSNITTKLKCIASNVNYLYLRACVYESVCFRVVMLASKLPDQGRAGPGQARVTGVE